MMCIGKINFRVIPGEHCPAPGAERWDFSGRGILRNTSQRLRLGPLAASA
jgi:hypothetical protein